MTIVWVKGKKLNICLRCGDVIVNRYKNAEYCKRCSREVRQENAKKAMARYNKRNGLYQNVRRKKK